MYRWKDPTSRITTGTRQAFTVFAHVEYSAQTDHSSKKRESLLPPGEGQDEGVNQALSLIFPLSPTLSRRERGY